jgi:hypothetical protein
LLSFADLLLEEHLDGLNLLVELREDRLDLVLALVDLDVLPVLARDRVERLGREIHALGEEHLALVVDEARLRRATGEELLHAGVGGLADDLDLIRHVLLELGALRVFDLSRAVVLLRALAGEDARVDDDAADARRDAQRGVTDIARLLTEDGAEQLLLGAELRLALRRDLADEDVAALHLGADPHDARVVEVLEGLLADVRDVARDLFLAELGVARDALELLDVHGGVDVLLRDALRDEDRVLEVVTAPRHERDDHVPAERELAHVAAGAVGDDVTDLDLLAGTDDRLLGVRGALVRALVLPESVDVGERTRLALGLDDDARRVDRLDHAVTLGEDADARVARDTELEARARRSASPSGAAAPPDAACSSP